MSVIKFEEGEKIVKIVRRHWFVLIPMLLTLLIAAVAPAIVFGLIKSGFVPFEQEFVEDLQDFIYGWKVFAYSIWLLLLWIVFFIEWTDYYLDVWVITDRRIIDIEQKGFFHREVTSFNFAQIQDITVETHGLIETFFKFGTLHIQTAGHNRKIIIPDARHPEEARSLILNLQFQNKEAK